MKNAFQIFGPFEVDGSQVAGREYQEAFWSEHDGVCPQLSEANGLYVFSLRNGSNYEPNYVGITKSRCFRDEVFNARNVVRILDRFVPARGTLCLHLLAKPKDHPNGGFYKAPKRLLIWNEMFLLLLCRRKNPEILNIVGHALLEDCGIEGVTHRSNGAGQHNAIRTFRNALAIDSFGMSAGRGRRRPTARAVTTEPPEASAGSPAAPLTGQPSAHPTDHPTAQPTAHSAT